MASTVTFPQKALQKFDYFVDSMYPFLAMPVESLGKVAGQKLLSSLQVVQEPRGLMLLGGASLIGAKLLTFSRFAINAFVSGFSPVLLAGGLGSFSIGLVNYFWGRIQKTEGTRTSSSERFATPPIHTIYVKVDRDGPKDGLFSVASEEDIFGFLPAPSKRFSLYAPTYRYAFFAHRPSSPTPYIPYRPNKVRPAPVVHSAALEGARGMVPA